MPNPPFNPTAIAVSGGVDSMALACLFSEIFKVYPSLRIADNPTDSAHGIIINHGLRQGSTEEALKVVGELKKLGISSIVQPLSWKDDRKQRIDPATLSNVESLARTLRYRALGTACRSLRATSLFFAHHRDDQYETVLMRLLAGHGYRGLQGMREANAIPECYDMHGIYKSGLLEDQLQRSPFLSFKPVSKEVRRLRSMFKSEDRVAGRRQSVGLPLSIINDISSRYPGHIVRESDPNVPYLTPLNTEDGGVTIYRPLLEFDKDRLRATCEAKGIRWFEDHTNADPTLTARNAIRHMCKSSQLPRALQKPSILALCKHSKRRVVTEEAEASRLLERKASIIDFDPNVGSMLVDMPPVRIGRRTSRSKSGGDAEKAKLPRQRLIAALAVRKLIDFVTPEKHTPPISALGNVTKRLYPNLYDEGLQNAERKAFSIAGVLLEPVASADNNRWFLSRAPYPSNKPLPTCVRPRLIKYKFGSWQNRLAEQAHHQQHVHQPWRSWKTARMWDGRFWIRVSSCAPTYVQVLPLRPEHAKPFRQALPPRERARLEKLLKYYAPGKVRYTLPGLYGVDEGDITTGEGGSLTLLALPTLGVQLPGLERWVKYETQYKKVDVNLLANQSRARTTPVMPAGSRCCLSRRIRRRRLARWKNEHMNRSLYQQV